MSTPATNAPARLDPEAVRKDFPILSRPVRRGQALVYLDSAATSQKPTAVLNAERDFYEQANAGVHRSIHWLAEQATERYERARKTIARFVDAPSERSVVFTRGTTEAINLVARAWGDRFVRTGDEIILTELEHHSNLVPWLMLARRKGAVLRYVPLTASGEPDMEAYRAMLTSRVRVVAAAHMSNVLGTVLPVREMARSAHEVGAVMLVDGAQSVPHLPVSVRELGCDFLAFSGHKMCGPTGIGALVASEALQEVMDPYMGGGEMIGRVTLDGFTCAEIPHKFEAGTPNAAGAVGLAAAAEYLAGLGLAAIRDHVADLTRYALARLDEMPGVKVHGRAAERGGAISFEVEGAHPHDVAHFLDRDGIAIRAGHMCAQPLMRKLGVPALSRASLYLYNTRDEVDQLVASLAKVREFFNRGN